MRFCVSCRQPKAVRNKADELKVMWKDIAFIDNYLDDKGNHTIILEIPKDENVDWDLMTMYNEKLEGNFMLCLNSLSDVPIARDRDIKFYWAYPVVSYYELNTLKNMGASQIIPGIPLIFDIKNLKMPLRLIPNTTQSEYLFAGDVESAGWIRPENLELYEDFAESCEFQFEHLTQEEALLNIYKKGVWKDDLSYLFPLGLSSPIYNAEMPKSFGKMRMNCKHLCQQGKCNYCYGVIKLANRTHSLRNLIKEKGKENNGD